MAKLFTVLASISGALSVIIGAFGAHKLRPFLEEHNRMETYHTASFYHLTHSILLLIIGLLATKYNSNLLNYAGYATIAGILLFSGSLYILCMTNTPKLGAITPFGGVFLIISWSLLAFFAYKQLG